MEPPCWCEPQADSKARREGVHRATASALFLVPCANRLAVVLAAVLALLLAAGSSYAVPMLVMLLIAQILQALMTYFVQEESVFATVAAALALKPLVDGFRIVFSIDDEAGFDAEFNFAASRFLETGAESVPQVLLQALALAGVEAGKRATGQFISISWSILRIFFFASSSMPSRLEWSL